MVDYRKEIGMRQAIGSKEGTMGGKGGSGNPVKEPQFDKKVPSETASLSLGNASDFRQEVIYGITGIGLVVFHVHGIPHPQLGQDFRVLLDQDTHGHGNHVPDLELVGVVIDKDLYAVILPSPFFSG